jgi:hypothetical protein
MLDSYPALIVVMFVEGAEMDVCGGACIAVPLIGLGRALTVVMAAADEIAKSIMSSTTIRSRHDLRDRPISEPGLGC